MECTFDKPGCGVPFTPVAAVTGGDIVQLADGRAAYSPTAIAAGVAGTVHPEGVVKVTKTASIALLKGGDAYWIPATGKAHFRGAAGANDFKMGTVWEDAAAADTYVYVNLNATGRYEIDLVRGDWFAEELAAGLAGSVNAYPGGGVQVVLSNENAVQANAIRSARTVLGSAKPIFEARVNIVAMTSATVDVDFGIGTGTHASDFESTTAFAAFHVDGDSANLYTHSDDNTTDRAPADSSVDYANGTYQEFWIDGRDETNVKFYIDGVLVDTSASKRTLALASAYAAVLEAEKTTGTATGEVIASRMRVRTNVE